MSLSNLYPTISPSLLLDFANSGVLDPGVTLTRLTGGTYFGPDGVLRTAQANAPRIDFDPSTLVCRGLLVEEQRANLMTYSEEFNDVTWLKQNVTVTPNDVAAPNGTLTADLVVDDTSVALQNHRVHAAPTTTAGVTHTASFFVRNIDATWVHIRDGTNGISCWFNLATKTIGINQFSSAMITEVGNQWLRLSVTWAPATASSSIGIGFAPSDGVNLYTTSTNTSIHIWGAQLEAGSFPTSYIPTTSTAVTRAADVASVNTLSPWFNASEGTLFAEYGNIAQTISGVGRRIFTVSDGTSSNQISLRWADVSAITNVSVTESGSAQVIITGDVSGTSKAALAYKINDFAISRNGGAVVTDTSGNVPAVNIAYMGLNADGATTASAMLNGHIQRITYYPRKLSSAELQAITA